MRTPKYLRQLRINASQRIRFLAEDGYIHLMNLSEGTATQNHPAEASDMTDHLCPVSCCLRRRFKSSRLSSNKSKPRIIASSSAHRKCSFWNRTRPFPPNAAGLDREGSTCIRFPDAGFQRAPNRCRPEPCRCRTDATDDLISRRCPTGGRVS